MCLAYEATHVGQRAIFGVHVAVFGNVVTVVTARRRVERQQPDGVHAQPGDIVQLRYQAREIALAIVVRVEERLDVQLIDHRILVPAGFIQCTGGARGSRTHGATPSDGASAHSTNGRSGVSTIAWVAPRSVKRRASNRSCNGSGAPSAGPHAWPGKSSVPVWGACASRLAVTRTILTRFWLCRE